MEPINKIGQDFTTFGLFKFALPSFFMNVFSQLFKSLDDALFISRYAGEKALAGINLLTPLDCIRLAFSHLFSLGAATISARLMGEKKQEEAKQIFTKIVISTIVCGSLFALLVNLLSHPMLLLFGASEELYDYALPQIRLVYSIAPISILNSVFTLYYATAGQPKMGTICSVASGITNIGLDLILVAKLRMGVLGAAIATAAGEILVFLIGLFFFLNKKHEIHFVKIKGDIVKPCVQCFKYALPQCINSLSFSVTALITNTQLLSLAGSDGVAANAIISDIRSILMSGLIGLAANLSPVVSYNYGERNVEKLRKTLYSILKIWMMSSIALIGIGLIIRTPLVKLFMSETSSQSFHDMVLFGITIEIFAVPFASACFTSSRLFIALNNAKAATAISIFRNLIFRALCLIILPLILGLVGVWSSLPVAEFLAFVFASILIYKDRDKYGYGKSKIATEII